MRTCSTTDCGRPHYGKGLCKPCWKRANYQPKGPRLWRLIQVTGSCWFWLGYTKDGYGTTHRNGRPVRVHRLVYELLVGPIADGMTLDHLCRMTTCCNPDHLEQVTPGENSRRARLHVQHTTTPCKAA